MYIFNTHTTATGIRERELETRDLSTRISYFVFRSYRTLPKIQHPTSTIQHQILNTNIILFMHSFGGLSPPKTAQGNE
jgi:hypothetical protein